MAYLTPEDVQNYINQDLTEEGITHVEGLIEAAVAAFESATNRAFDSGGQPIAETHFNVTRTIYPRHTPITAVTALASGDVVILPTSYVVTPTMVRLRFTYLGDSLTITYTADDPVPADVKLALTHWVADQMVTAARASDLSVRRLTQGPVTIEYATQPIGSHGLPDYLEEVISRYRLPSH